MQFDSTAQKRLFLGILTLSILLRLTLGIVNNGAANDDHYQVIELIADSEKSVEPASCWQCYHPKVYHHTIAKIWKLFQLQEKTSRIIAGQLFNSILGIGTVWLIWLFIASLPFLARSKIYVFAFMALNPRLIGINCHISNDSLIIFLGTLTIYHLYKLCVKLNWTSFIYITTASMLAGGTKTNSLILFIGVSMVLLIQIILDAFQGKRISTRVRQFLLFFVLVGISTAILGEYVSNIKKHGKAVVYNTEIGEPPNFWEETIFRRPGITSIAKGFFTFRYFDMLAHPKVSHDENNYPIHRTSLWSQLYGRYHFIYFDDHPMGAWQSNDPVMMRVGQVALSLGLLPLCLLIVGLFSSFKIWFAMIKERSLVVLVDNTDWIFHIFIVGYICFILLFVYVGRDFSFMKIIYLFPAYIAIVYPFLRGIEFFYEKNNSKKALIKLFDLGSVLLLIAYIVPLIHVITVLT